MTFLQLPSHATSSQRSIPILCLACLPSDARIVDSDVSLMDNRGWGVSKARDLPE